MLLTDWKTLVQELIYKILPRERMSGNLTQRDRDEMAKEQDKEEKENGKSV